MRLIVLILAVLSATGAAATFSREYRAASFARSSQLSAFDALSQKAGIPALPFSSRGMKGQFETCGAVQQGLIHALQPFETRGAVDAACRDMARAALVKNPTFAAAHTILMLSSHAPSDIAGSLILSKITAPRESWHAKLRLRKGLRLHDMVDEVLDRTLEADIAFMMQTAGGRAWLARFYRNDPHVRPILVSTIDRSPNSEKSAFLQEVQRLGQD